MRRHRHVVVGWVAHRVEVELDADIGRRFPQPPARARKGFEHDIAAATVADSSHPRDEKEMHGLGDSSTQLSLAPWGVGGWGYGC